VPPETRDLRLDGDRIAYQAFGEGPPDLVLAPGELRPHRHRLGGPGIALFYRSLASSCRLIVFDRRGTGISDPLPPDPLPPWESYARELGAVLDEVGAERAALLAEVELRDGDVGGIAVHIAARVLAAVRPGDIVTSRTVRDLVVGSDIALHDRGAQPLKGVEGTWELFSAVRP
jgi:pimeloyl-ACP methyl ester carboxylesterase